MTWQEIEQLAREVIDAHPDLEPADYAKLLNHQFHEQPIIGWLLLERLGKTTESDKPEPQGG